MRCWRWLSSKQERLLAGPSGQDRLLGTYEVHGRYMPGIWGCGHPGTGQAGFGTEQIGFGKFCGLARPPAQPAVRRQDGYGWGVRRGPSGTRAGDERASKTSWPMAASVCSASPPARAGRGGHPLLQTAAPVIESINHTFKGQLDLDRHGGHTPAGVMARVLQRILALTAAIWHNDRTGEPVRRSLVAYDH